MMPQNINMIGEMREKVNVNKNPKKEMENRRIR